MHYQCTAEPKLTYSQYSSKAEESDGSRGKLGNPIEELSGIETLAAHATVSSKLHLVTVVVSPVTAKIKINFSHNLK